MIKIESRGTSKIIQKKNGRKWYRYLEKTKEKEKKEERKFRKKNQYRFGRLVQPWTVDVLALNWSTQLQDLCWRDTSSSDQREELQEPQVLDVTNKQSHVAPFLKSIYYELRARLHETRSESNRFEISNRFEKSFHLHGDFTVGTCK